MSESKKQMEGRRGCWSLRSISLRTFHVNDKAIALCWTRIREIYSCLKCETQIRLNRGISQIELPMWKASRADSVVGCRCNSLTANPGYIMVLTQRKGSFKASFSRVSKGVMLLKFKGGLFCQLCPLSALKHHLSPTSHTQPRFCPVISNFLCQPIIHFSCHSNPAKRLQWPIIGCYTRILP